MAASRTRGKRLAGDLLAEGLTSYYTEDPEREVLPGEILITYGNMQKGYEYPLIKFVVISESDIFGQVQKKKKKHRRYEGKRISSFTELSVVTSLSTKTTGWAYTGELKRLKSTISQRIT